MIRAAVGGDVQSLPATPCSVSVVSMGQARGIEDLHRKEQGGAAP